MSADRTSCPEPRSGDGQRVQSGLILSTESTTDLFTKHLCSAERVHGKERPGGRQGPVVVGSGAVGRCLARQGQHSQRECGQPECVTLISLSLKKGRTGDDENPSFEMANKQSFKVTTISSFNIICSKPQGEQITQ